MTNISKSIDRSFPRIEVALSHNAILEHEVPYFSSSKKSKIQVRDLVFFEIEAGTPIIIGKNKYVILAPDGTFSKKPFNISNIVLDPDVVIMPQTGIEQTIMREISCILPNYCNVKIQEGTLLGQKHCPTLQMTCDMDVEVIAILNPQKKSKKIKLSVHLQIFLFIVLFLIMTFAHRMLGQYMICV